MGASRSKLPLSRKHAPSRCRRIEEQQKHLRPRRDHTLAGKTYVLKVSANRLRGIIAVHAFTLCGPDMSVCGPLTALGSTVLNTTQDPSLFVAGVHIIHTILCYAARLRSVLSLDTGTMCSTPPSIGDSRSSEYISCPPTLVPCAKHWINTKPISSRFAIKTRGGTYYEAQRA